MAAALKVGAERGSTGRIKTSFRLAEKAKQPARDEKNVRAVARLQKLRMIIMALLEDPFLGSPCGQMWLLEIPVRIDAAEYEAGVRLHRIISDYDRVVLGVNRGVKAQNLTSARGASTKSGPTESDVKEASKALMEVEAILGRAGPDVACAAKALVRGEDWERRTGAAILGLRALCKAWGLYDLPEPKVKKSIKEVRQTVSA